MQTSWGCTGWGGDTAKQEQRTGVGRAGSIQEGERDLRNRGIHSPQGDLEETKRGLGSKHHDLEGPRGHEGNLDNGWQVLPEHDSLSASLAVPEYKILKF